MLQGILAEKMVLHKKKKSLSPICCILYPHTMELNKDQPQPASDPPVANTGSRAHWAWGITNCV